MSDQLRRGLDWIAGRLDAAASRAITYRRGEESVQLAATVGQSDQPVGAVGEDGMTLYVRVLDFLVTAEHLTLGGARIEPRAGDRIEADLGGGLETFAVLAIAGEQPWRWSDPQRVRIRIHTKRIG